MKTEVIEAFAKAYGDSAGVRTFFAPGRVNLIGEHTDYNGGHVFPCALTIGTYAAVRLRDDNICRFYSKNFPEIGVIREGGFANYPLGVVKMLKDAGYNIDKGFDVAYYGDIPYASGLSSSASVEVLTGYFLKELFGLDIENTEIALIGQKCENEFIGVNCGIMDQFIIANGKKDYATFLDTSTLEFSYVPIKLDGMKLIIACTNKKRGLKDSKYNERRAECEQAVKDIGNISFLGELTTEEFEDIKDKINNEVNKKRARHAVYENARTIKACDALKNNDIETFGKLMNESHISLRDDYEVTGIELDTLVSTAWEQEGVIGSRMTGAGFGGCTVSIVKDNYIDDFIFVVGKKYKEKIGYPADFYIVEIGDGPCEI
ncbi:MAG: galactokinase [Clostridia bacterium]|nr:galactokinase [Clostridia bacterium]